MAAASEIDEDLHSRQLAVYGREEHEEALAGATVLICGMKGLGAEIAKNVILAGVKGVTIQDASACELADLGAQFYLSEADVGKNRAEACARPSSRNSIPPSPSPSTPARSPTTSASSTR